MEPYSRSPVNFSGPHYSPSVPAFHNVYSPTYGSQDSSSAPDLTTNPPWSWSLTDMIHHPIPSVVSTLPAHHARIEISRQAAVCVWGSLAFAGQDQTEISDTQGMQPCPFSCPSISEVGAGMPRAWRSQVGRVAIGRCLQHLETRFRMFLPLI